MNRFHVEKIVVRMTIEEHLDDGSIMQRTEQFTSDAPEDSDIEMLRTYIESVGNLQALSEVVSKVPTLPPPRSN